MEASDFVLVVDSSVEEQVEELAVFLDQVEANQEKNVLASCKQFLASENINEALSFLLNRLSLLSQISEKEFEPMMNVFVSLLQESTTYEEHVVKFCQALESIVEQNTSFVPFALSVLSTLFNASIKDHQHARLHILNSVVTITTRFNYYQLLSPYFVYFPEWLHEAGVSVSDQRAFYVFVSKVIQSYDEEQSFAFLLEAVKMAPSSTDEAVRELVQHAVNSPKYFFYDDIVTLPAIQQLEQATLQLLGILSGGMIEDFFSWMDANRSFCQQEKFDQEAITRKMKLLTIASLATQAPNNVLSYKDIAKVLQTDESEVELWIIDVIRAGLVEGRMSQLNQTFLIHRSSYRVFGKHEWISLHEKLAKWSSSLQYMLQVMDQPLSNFTLATSRKGGREHAGISASE
ncbi:translation initiation factor eIF3m [Schizosaccharomyces cryophilus OY26]|uniref:Eukaryotic translation initiation factor 3 subunit M n=1 Tax=Schizosaccharomyces cryophilus (strain OY26 / ATCC MYA-4695 / CBS 11777 / NBRC 106824 / NRRL Y48691) TaxID=653667 RepID=S9W0U3_SCHCR|nr:translation initiation factor eIF3m [Schizosaccharomyces cryophilus OY26]EPY53478.1 translation initiation factor eIF3m [Schizosaccharomyces cryophilus OY26]